MGLFKKSEPAALFFCSIKMSPKNNKLPMTTLSSLIPIRRNFRKE